MQTCKPLAIFLSFIFLSTTALSLEVITRKTHYLYEYGISVDNPLQLVEDKVFFDIPIGIRVFSSRNVIRQCIFINCDDEGIVLFSNYNLIIDCYFYNCCDGVELQKSSFNFFINCTFENCYHAGIDGIIHSNNNNWFVNCKFINNTVFDVYFHNSICNHFIGCRGIENYQNLYK